MQFLVPLASLLGIEIETITDRVKQTIIVNAIMGVFGMLAAVFLIVAGYLALADALSPIVAALILGGVFLVLAIGVYAGAQISAGKRRRAAVEKRRSSETGAFMTTAALTALPMLLRSPIVRTLGLPAAAIAAFLLTRGGSDKND